jgi:hypothetical protein
MNTFEFLDSIDDRITSYVAKFQEVTGEDLGLDGRAAYRLYVDRDHTCIAVDKRNDRTLQYYGCFEYVDTDFRRELGNWVFYFAEDDRVARALENLKEEKIFVEADDDNALQEDF